MLMKFIRRYNVTKKDIITYTAPGVISFMLLLVIFFQYVELQPTLYLLWIFFNILMGVFVVFFTNSGLLIRSLIRKVIYNILGKKIDY